MLALPEQPLRQLRWRLRGVGRRDRRGCNVRHVLPAVQDLRLLGFLRPRGLLYARGRDSCIACHGAAGSLRDNGRLHCPHAITVVNQVARHPSPLRALAADGPPGSGPLQPLLPERVLVQGRLGADHDATAASSRKHHVQAAPIGQEADFALAIVAHSAEDDYFLLLALEAVDGLHLEAGAELLQPGTVPDNFLDEINLALVGRDQPDVLRAEQVRFADLLQRPQCLLGLAGVDV
mmetsp:Transcript_49980/g.98770  ORF Transcript_49980/g.98770 Transcript_49980/m.98770 type:complete len:235 (-) Transcript_49980:358-1062(-)